MTFLLKIIPYEKLFVLVVFLQKIYLTSHAEKADDNTHIFMPVSKLQNIYLSYSIWIHVVTYDRIIFNNINKHVNVHCLVETMTSYA